MEWQAAYIGGALLMPRYSLRLWAGEIAMREKTTPPVSEASALGHAMILRVMRRCQVSEQAARVRLRHLGLFSKWPYVA